VILALLDRLVPRVTPVPLVLPVLPEPPEPPVVVVVVDWA